MTLDKSCPGSRIIREPIPEYMKCTNCGYDVEIWTDELKATCPRCGTKVFRQALVSCIDWCPHAKECVGPEVYERLRPGMQEDLSGTPLDVLQREHDRVLETLGLLRAASLCLKLGTLSFQSQIWDKGVGHLEKVLDFFDKDVGLHFQREEEVLFPALDAHIGGEKSPTQRLLEEHREIWQWYNLLKAKLVELQQGGEDAKSLSGDIQDASAHFEQLIQEHVRKENASLLPIAKGVLSDSELEQVGKEWRQLGAKVA